MAKDDYSNNTSTQGKLTIPAYGLTAITSYFDNPDDHDWFAISLVAGKHYIFSSNSFTDELIDIRNTAGEKQTVGHSRFSGIDFIPAKSGNYYLDISSYDKAFLHEYTLFATEVKDDYGDYATAAYNIALVPGQKASVNGVIETFDDQDWFKFEGVAGKHYKIDFFLTDEVGIHKSDDLVSVSTATGDSVASGNNNAFIFTAPSTGPFYLVTNNLNIGSKYILNIAEQANNDDYGNTAQTAEQLILSNANPTIIEGHIENKGDHDWFRVSLVAGRTYSFSNKGSNLTFSPTLALHNAAGDIAVSGASKYFQYTPSKSGDYYIDVAAANGKQTGIYPLTVNLESDDYLAHISNLKPIDVGNVTRFDAQRFVANDHDWIPLKLEADKSYAISNLYQLFGQNEGTNFIHTADFSETLLSLRDSQGNLLPHGISQGNDFAFTSATSDIYYLDVSAKHGQYPFAPLTVRTYHDDYADTTNSLGQLAVSTIKAVSAQGRIEVAGDHDWFKLSLQAGKQYVLGVYPASSAKNALTAPMIQLYDATGHLLSSTAARQLSFTPGKTSDYFLDVAGGINRETIFSEEGTTQSPSNFKGNYTVTVAQDNDDFGNSHTTATPFNVIVPNASTIAIQGSIEKTGDHDWMAVKLLVGKTYNFKLDATTIVNANTSKLETIALSLYNSKGLLINKDSDTGQSSNLSFTPEKSGTYYLDVAAASQQTGGYTLNVGSMKDDRPNHISTSPALSRTGDLITIDGRSDFANDHDWFPITLVKGESITYDTSEHPISVYLSPLLAIRDATGKLLVTPQKFGDFTAPHSGRYYVDVGAESNPGNVFITKDYHSRVFFPNSSPIDNDPADSSTKSVLDFSGNTTHSINGNTGGADFEDWIKISVHAGQRYTITFMEGSDAQYFLSVLDATGKAITNAVYSDEALSFIAAKSGNYYLSISSWEGSYQVTGQQGIPFGTTKNDVLKGSAGNNLLYGLAGDDSLNGSAGNDILKGGTGKDSMVGGTGSDIYYVDDKGDRVKEGIGNLHDIDTVYSTVGYTLPANVENLISRLPSDSTKTVLFQGNQRNNLIISESNQGNGIEILKGGAGNDILKDNSSHNPDSSGSTYLLGGSGNDTLIGGDRLNGGAGKDRYEIISTYDSDGYSYRVVPRVEISKGDSLPSSFDVIKHFALTNNNANSYATRLDLDTPNIAPNVGTANGKDVGIIHSHHISQGLIHFDDTDTYRARLQLSTENLTDTIKYVQTNITHAGDTVAFVVGHDTYVFQDGGASDTLVELIGVTAHSIHNYTVNGSILLV